MITEEDINSEDTGFIFGGVTQFKYRGRIIEKDSDEYKRLTNEYLDKKMSLLNCKKTNNTKLE